MEYSNKIIKEIYPKDGSYNGNIDSYLQAGQTAIDSIQNAMKLSNKDISTVKNILDFPSGGGRILRHLKVNFPNSSITAGDIEKDAVDFCHKWFNAKLLYSQKEFEKIIFEEKYNLIWCGSLFTHLKRTSWESLLNTFSNILENQGLLVFTVHGRNIVQNLTKEIRTYGLTAEQIRDLLGQYKSEGFGYVNYTDWEDYGISLSSPSAVFKILEKRSDLEIVMYLERGLNQHQDVIACFKRHENFTTA